MLKKHKSPKKTTKAPIFLCKCLKKTKYLPKISTISSLNENSKSDCDSEKVDIITINMENPASPSNIDLECIGENCPNMLTPPPSQHPAVDEPMALLTQQSTVTTVIVPYDLSGGEAGAADAADADDAADATAAADDADAPYAADNATNPTADLPNNSTGSIDDSVSDVEVVPDDGDVNCDVCKTHVGMTLTCTNCRRCICTTCSKLESIYFALFKATRRTYSCTECASDMLDKSKPEIREAVELEFKKQGKKARKNSKNKVNFIEVPCNVPTPTSTMATQTETTHNEEQQIKTTSINQKKETNKAEVSTNKTLDETSTNVSPKKSDEKKKDICKFYKKGICKGKLQGDTCPYRHPKACRYYLQGWCKKQNKCRFLHPKICRSSETDYTCFNENCGFYHLKGTQRYRIERQAHEKPYRSQPRSDQSPFMRQGFKEEEKITFLDQQVENLQAKIEQIAKNLNLYQAHFPPLPTRQIPQTQLNYPSHLHPTQLQAYQPHLHQQHK